MRRTAVIILVAALTGSGLVGCARTSPVPSVTASAPSSPASPTTSASPTPTPTPTPPPTPTATDDGAGLVLRGDGVGEHLFGAKQVVVAPELLAALGTPQDRSAGVRCPLDDGSPWTQMVSWDSFWVEYEARGTRKSPRTLAAWGAAAGSPLPAPLVLQDEVPIGLSFTELAAAYPLGELEDLGLGDGSKRFTLPNGIFFVGAGDEPLRVQAGDFGICE